MSGWSSSYIRIAYVSTTFDAKLHGRIIMTHNVFDADAQNKLARLHLSRRSSSNDGFSCLFQIHNSAEDVTQFSLSKDVDGIMDDGSHMKTTKGVYKKTKI